ncbi:hypothetical protein [Dictyobacter formicarum]|uniref:Transposase DDE domain-containing protein n=1 Tax=Dictyobacter formicarum TaxID=2778368 RepID=A0ABQ3VEL2_9CHLR|nr:hypothetical protein [Dictyobacter formicarum]GHO84415.1 hypothetical protein KSZ_24210 [Dictyobacter formicarum]
MPCFSRLRPLTLRACGAHKVFYLLVQHDRKTIMLHQQIEKARTRMRARAGAPGFPWSQVSGTF